MFIKINKACVVKGVHCAAGSTVETDLQTATYLVNIGKAEKTEAPKPKAKAKPKAKKAKKPAPPPEPETESPAAPPAD